MRFDYNPHAVLKEEKKNGYKRVPLRTTVELAAEFKVSVQFVSSKLGRAENPPKAKLRINNAKGLTTWWDPVEFRKWWKSLDIK